MAQRTTALRRIACNEILTLEGKGLTRHVVEILNGNVLKVYPLVQEMPSTEWWPGRITLKRDEAGNLIACYRGKAIT